MKTEVKPSDWTLDWSRFILKQSKFLKLKKGGNKNEKKTGCADYCLVTKPNKEKADSSSV